MSFGALAFVLYGKRGLFRWNECFRGKGDGLGKSKTVVESLKRQITVSGNRKMGLWGI